MHYRLAIGVSDKHGRAALTWPTVYNGSTLAPLLMTDTKGRKFLRTLYSTALMVTSPLGLDTYNRSWIRVGRDRTGTNCPVVTVGNQIHLGSKSGLSNFENSAPAMTLANYKKLFLGLCQTKCTVW